MGSEPGGMCCAAGTKSSLALSRKLGGICCIVAASLPCIVLVICEVFVPRMITSKLHQALVDETLNIGDRCDPNWKQNVSITVTVFNLTNAYELQTIKPAPKPHFDAIDVEFTEMGKSFNCSLLDDGEKVKYYKWSKWVPTNPDVYSWEFVQVNPAYLGTVGALAPSEAMLLVGLSHHILGSARQVMEAFGASIIASGTGAEIMVGRTLGENLSTAQAVGAAQYGTSAFTNLSGSASVASDARMQAVGVCTPIELGTYINDLVSGPFAPGGMLATLLLAHGFKFSSFSMSVAEATAFLARFTDATGAASMGAPNWAAALGQLVKTYVAALQAGNSTAAAGVASLLYSATAAPGVLFAPTFGKLLVMHISTSTEMPMCSSSAGGDFCPLLAGAYASYLNTYLPEKFFVGCQLLGCADGSCMHDDGTFPKNSGLFTRLTLREMLHDGNSDQIFAAAPAAAVPVGVKLEYNGLLGKHAYMNATLNDLRGAGTDMETLSRVQMSGKGDINHARAWVEYMGSAYIEAGNAKYPGWGTNGTPGGRFDVTGLHSNQQQAPQTNPNSPIAMVMKGHKSLPSFGTSIDFLLTAIRRPVTLACGAGGSPPNNGECEFHTLKGIHTQKFTVSKQLLKMKKAGAVTDSCSGTVSKSYATTFPGTTREGPDCDYLQRNNGIVNMAVARDGAPLAVTHGFLGQTETPVRDAVSITRPGEPSEIYYDASSDELAVFIEPITGVTMTAYERLQINWYIERSMIDSALYANIFTAETDNDDVFVWPFMYTKKEPAITESGAEKFVSLVYGAYDDVFYFELLSLILSVVCLFSGAICCKPERCGKIVGKSTTPTPEGEDQQVVSV